jgi:hypothetical protein
VPIRSILWVGNRFFYYYYNNNNSMHCHHNELANAGDLGGKYRGPVTQRLGLGLARCRELPGARGHRPSTRSSPATGSSSIRRGASSMS